MDACVGDPFTMVELAILMDGKEAFVDALEAVAALAAN